MRSYLSTSISNYIVVSCRFDILEGYRVIQFQYRVCKQIPPLIPSHPREWIENHSENNRYYFRAHMVFIAVPFYGHLRHPPHQQSGCRPLPSATATADARIALSLAMNDCHHIKRHNFFSDLATITEGESTITKVTQKFNVMSKEHFRLFRNKCFNSVPAQSQSRRTVTHQSVTYGPGGPGPELLRMQNTYSTS
jgi:hypothetical protein